MKVLPFSPLLPVKARLKLRDNYFFFYVVCAFRSEKCIIFYSFMPYLGVK